MIKKNILIIGAGSGIGRSLSESFNNSNLFVTFNKTKINLNFNFNYQLNLESEKELLNFSEVIKTKKTVFDIIYFIGAYTPHYEKKISKSTFLGSFSQQIFNKFLNINCFAPIFILQNLYKDKLINKNAKVIFFSSLAGSISNRGVLKHNVKGGNQLYRISKSALNSAVRNIAYDLNHTNITIVSMHPGWIKTKSGGEKADLGIGEATKSIINFTNKLNKSYHGGFYFSNGDKIDW